MSGAVPSGSRVSALPINSIGLASGVARRENPQSGPATPGLMRRPILCGADWPPLDGPPRPSAPRRIRPVHLRLAEVRPVHLRLAEVRPVHPAALAGGGAPGGQRRCGRGPAAEALPAGQQGIGVLRQSAKSALASGLHGAKLVRGRRRGCRGMRGHGVDVLARNHAGAILAVDFSERVSGGRWGRSGAAFTSRICPSANPRAPACPRQARLRRTRQAGAHGLETDGPGGTPLGLRAAARSRRDDRATGVDFPSRFAENIAR